MERRARWRATVREQFEDVVGRRAFGRQRLGERRWYVARHRIPFDILHGLPCLSSFGVQLHCNHDLDSKGGGRPNGSYQQCSKHQNVAPRVASCFVCLSTWGHKVGLHFAKSCLLQSRGHRGDLVAQSCLSEIGNTSNTESNIAYELEQEPCIHTPSAQSHGGTSEVCSTRLNP